MSPRLLAALQRVDALEAANQLLRAQIIDLQQQLAAAQEPHGAKRTAAYEPGTFTGQSNSIHGVQTAIAMIDDGTMRTSLSTKRTYSDLVDEANERATQAEHDRAVARSEIARLIVKHGCEVAAFEQQLAGLRAELFAAEADADQNGRDVRELRQKLVAIEAEKLKKTGVEDVEMKWAVAKLEIAAMKAELEEMEVDNEKKLADMKQRLFF